MAISNRVATAQGILMLTFPDMENRELSLISTRGKLWQHRENFEFV